MPVAPPCPQLSQPKTSPDIATCPLGYKTVLVEDPCSGLLPWGRLPCPRACTHLRSRSAATWLSEWPSSGQQSRALLLGRKLCRGAWPRRTVAPRLEGRSLTKLGTKSQDFLAQSPCGLWVTFPSCVPRAGQGPLPVPGCQAPEGALNGQSSGVSF